MTSFKNRGSPRLGVVSLDGIGYPSSTVDLPDPFNAPPPPPGEPTGTFFHPNFWPVPFALTQSQKRVT